MKKNQQGFSLVELMIAMTLGLILLSGIIQLLLGGKATFATQQAVSRVQESGRLAMEFLSKDIRMAGYTGCASRKPKAIDSTLNSKTGFGTALTVPIQGYVAKKTGEAAIELVTNTIKLAKQNATDVIAVPNSDILVLSTASATDTVVSKTNDAANLFTSISAKTQGTCANGDEMISGLCKGDVLAVSDCEYTRIFQATNLVKAGTQLNIVHSSGGTLGNTLSSWQPAKNSMERFEQGAFIFKMSRVAYFVGINPTTNRSSLYQFTNGVTTELIEGVEDMRLSYGVDTNTGNSASEMVADTYKTAVEMETAPKTPWDNVLSVRIQLLVQSADNALPQSRNITFNGATKTYDAKDRKLRQVFVSTIGLRNRIM